MSFATNLFGEIKNASSLLTILVVLGSYFGEFAKQRFYREVKMDPHEQEASAAISLVKDFYGSVDSPDKRKIFSKRRVCVAGESMNESDQELAAAGAKTTVQI